MHLYEHHVELANKIVKAGPSPEFEMPPMSEPDQLAQFLQREKSLREGKSYEKRATQLNSYWTGLLSVLEWFASQKRSRLDNGRNSNLGAPTPYARLLGQTKMAKATFA
jgi:hypothetical protein